MSNDVAVCALGSAAIAIRSARRWRAHPKNPVQRACRSRSGKTACLRRSDSARGRRDRAAAGAASRRDRDAQPRCADHPAAAPASPQPLPALAGILALQPAIFAAQQAIITFAKFEFVDPDRADRRHHVLRGRRNWRGDGFDRADRAPKATGRIRQSVRLNSPAA